MALYKADLCWRESKPRSDTCRMDTVWRTFLSIFLWLKRSIFSVFIDAYVPSATTCNVFSKILYEKHLKKTIFLERPLQKSQNTHQGQIKKFRASSDIDQKGLQKFYYPYSVLSLSVLHQNKLCIIFTKEGSVHLSEA